MKSTAPTGTMSAGSSRQPWMRRKIRGSVKRANKVLPKFGLAVVEHDPRDAPVPRDIDSPTREIIERVHGYTLTTHERIDALCEAVRVLSRRSAPGAIVECGAWRGGSMMAAALALQQVGDTGRDIYLFDTFSHMPDPDPSVDVRHDGQRDLAGSAPGDDVPELFRYLSVDEVRDAMESTGYPPERIHLVEGLIEDTVPGQAPDEIALLRLDTDWYGSTVHELEHLYPRLSPGGVLIVDDYGSFAGARKAVDEYFGTERSVMFHRIDSDARLIIRDDQR